METVKKLNKDNVRVTEEPVTIEYDRKTLGHHINNQVLLIESLNEQIAKAEAEKAKFESYLTDMDS